MTKPDETVWHAEPTTLAKHALLRNYLYAWLPIMSRYNERLVLVDGFAGPGVYSGGEPGSPIVMLKAFLDHAYREKIRAELVYVFIEQDAARAAQLTDEIGKLVPLPDQVRFSVISGTFDEEFSELLDDLDQRGARLAPTFAFVDPFGYTGAPMSLSGRFLQFDRCEALIYFPLPYIVRFISLPDQAAGLNALFGTEKWRDACDLEGEERKRFLHDLFRTQLERECGLEYVRSFEIVKRRRNLGYHLFFGTKHKTGLRAMKEAMWAIDPVAGQRFWDSTDPDVLVLFQSDAEVDTGPLLDAMRRNFGTKPFSIDDAEDLALVDTPYLPSHVRRVLKPLEKDGDLEFVSGKPKRKRWTYPSGTRIRFVDH